uniref:Uncharacterized protein n=1 Tax=Triticum urartu TaxID=4572 RepID=A0A8R7U059_TRIUA
MRSSAAPPTARPASFSPLLDPQVQTIWK